MKKIFFYSLITICLVSLAVSCSGENKTAGGVEIDQGIATIENKKISGYSQKGPFVSGASVTLLELDTSFTQTGLAFYTDIVNDRGEFRLEKVSLETPYATLIANGYYRNEVSGKTSSGTIELRAISDLSHRETVNINLLTHLEYKRLLNLLDSGMNLTKAKAKAEKEILSAFYITLDEATSASDYFEDMNIFEATSADAALLAASVLSQGNLSEGDFTERLTKMATDFADGSWNDEKTKTNMADWASDYNMTTIRENILNWGFSDTVSAFEKMVNNFWGQIYGLGKCSQQRNGEFAQNSNEQSVFYKTWYQCVDEMWEMTLKVDKNAVGEGFDVWYYGKATDGGHSYEKDCIEDKRVLTEFIDPCSFKTGYWGFYTSGEGSSVSWGPSYNMKEGNQWGEKDLAYIVEACKGVCGNITTIGYGDDRPYNNFALQISLVDNVEQGEDVQKWRGICLEYSHTFKGYVKFHIVPSKELNGLYAHWFVELPVSDTLRTVNTSWDEFEASPFTPRDKQVSLLDNVRHFAQVVIQFDSAEPMEGTFSITKIGAYGTCNK